MTYKILTTRTMDVTLITTVEYNFDSVISTVDVPHYMPQSQTEIEANIVNASQSELARLQAIEVINTLVSELPVNVEKPIE